MKKGLLLICFLFFRITLAQLLNGSFENTIVDTNPFDSTIDERPENWMFFASIGTQITTDAYEGNNAIKICSWYFGQANTALIYGDSYPQFGDTLTSRPSKLKGYYKFTDPNVVNQVKDSAVVAVLLTKFNIVSNQRDTIIFIEKRLNESLNYIPFEVPFTYQNAIIPDSISINFKSSLFEWVGSVPQESNYLYLDKLSLENDVLSIQDNDSQSEIVIYPNPSKDILYIKPLNCNYVYFLYDCNGKKVANGRLDEANQSINITKISKGSYLLELHSLNGIITKTILKD